MTLTDYLLEKCLLDLSLAKSEITNTEHRDRLTKAQDIIKEIVSQRSPF